MQTTVKAARNNFVTPRPVTYRFTPKYTVRSSHHTAIGCMENALANCPINKNHAALLSPQPGHGSPVAITIGQNA